MSFFDIISEAVSQRYSKSCSYIFFKTYREVLVYGSLCRRLFFDKADRATFTMVFYKLFQAASLQ